MVVGAGGQSNDTTNIVDLGLIRAVVFMRILFMKQSCASQDVMEVKHVPRIRFCGLNPQDISNNLALGQPWSSELETIDTTNVVNSGLTCEVVFMGI